MTNPDTVPLAGLDHRDLLRALHGALLADVRRAAITSAISAVLGDETTELEAAMILRRLTRSKSSRRVS